MKRLIYQTALIAYVNAICFRTFRPTCTKASKQYNRNIIYDSEHPYVSHDRLQRLLVLEGKWNKYIQKHYSCLIKLRESSSKKTYLIIDDTVVAKPYNKELDLLSWIFSPSDRRVSQVPFVSLCYHTVDLDPAKAIIASPSFPALIVLTFL